MTKQKTNSSEGIYQCASIPHKMAYQIYVASKAKPFESADGKPYGVKKLQKNMHS